MRVGTPGGAIYNTGTLTLEDAVVSDSHAAGGTAPTVSCDPTTGCPGSNAGAGGSGGGIYNDGSLTVTRSTITGNRAGAGGDGTEGTEGTDDASEDGGDAGNGGNGGGIYNDASGSLQISDSTISDNRAGLGGTGGEGFPAGMPSTVNGGSSGNGGAGGGIYSANGLAITDSTISANHAGSAGSAALRGGAPGIGGAGGGIDNSGGTGASTITDATITGNASGAAGHDAFQSDLGPAGAGGGIEQSEGTVELEFVTLAADQAPASSFPGPSGVYGEIGATGSASVDLENSITDDEQVGNGGPYEECTSGVQDGGGNVQFGAQQATCPGTVADPKLDTLANNGGSTETMALEAGSAAIDHVPASSCSQPTDQRGVARPQSGCDAGAYQLAAPSISAFTVKATSPTTIAVSGQIDPNLSAQSTTLTVRYGATSAFGSSTTATNLGAGNTAMPFSVTLTRLTVGTTYHVEIVATNGDGTSTDPLGTVTTRGYPRIKAQIMAAWTFARRSTTLLELRLSHIPSGGAVHVNCHGGGCPFARRTFKVKHGAASATSAFKDRRLKPRATVEIEITARDSVGEVMVFTIRTRKPPSATRRCMPPGTRSPTACTERQREAARPT